jgi:hypothetical protein
VERSHHAFDTRGWRPLTRGAWERDGHVVVENACTAGFDLLLSATPEHAEFTYRWRPPRRDRTAALVLRSRFHLLARAVLEQYPALWWAGTRRRAPLHASACLAGDSTPLLTGPSGAGRSTVILELIAADGRATGDNLAVSDGTAVWGLVEPLRITGGDGRRMPHGRREAPMVGRPHRLVPDSVIVLRRGLDERPSLVPCEPDAAVRALVTSTYMAGELRRFWSFAATLSAATGIGPIHPPMIDVAAALVARLPCFELVLARRPGTQLAELLSSRDKFEVVA